MIIGDDTAGDSRFVGVELSTYVSDNHLVVVVNQSNVYVMRLVLTPFDLGAGRMGLLQAIARHSLPVMLTLGEDMTAGEPRGWASAVPGEE